MCRNLFYTIDSDRMQAWLSNWQHTCNPCLETIPQGEIIQVENTLDAAGERDVWGFLTDPERENVMRGWARGTMRHPPKHPLGETAAWIPPRHVVSLHTQVTAEVQTCLLKRGHVIRDEASGSGRSGEIAPIQAAERAFLDSLKPLLGIWYGRLLLLRAAGGHWLVAQVEARAWTSWLGGEVGRGEYSELLTFPTPGSVLWGGGDVVEMFGARCNDRCCCSLVESPADPEVEALEVDFLDALGLAVSSSSEGTVLIDIDADYAEPV